MGSYQPVGNRRKDAERHILVACFSVSQLLLLPTMMTRCWSLSLLLFLSVTSLVSSAASSGGNQRKRRSVGFSSLLPILMGGGLQPWGYPMNEYGYPNAFGLGSPLFQDYANYAMWFMGDGGLWGHGYTDPAVAKPATGPIVHWDHFDKAAGTYEETDWNALVANLANPQPGVYKLSGIEQVAWQDPQAYQKYTHPGNHLGKYLGLGLYGGL